MRLNIRQYEPIQFQKVERYYIHVHFFILNCIPGLRKLGARLGYVEPENESRLKRRSRFARSTGFVAAEYPPCEALLLNSERDLACLFFTRHCPCEKEFAAIDLNRRK